MISTSYRGYNYSSTYNCLGPTLLKDFIQWSFQAPKINSDCGYRIMHRQKSDEPTERRIVDSQPLHPWVVENIQPQKPPTGWQLMWRRPQLRCAGKTCAFLLPIISSLDVAQVRGLWDGQNAGWETVTCHFPEKMMILVYLL